MLRDFYAKSGGIFGIPWEHASAMETVWQTMERGVCMVGDHSCAGAIFGGFPYNRSVKVAQVVFWYFTKPREMRIFHELAIACCAGGCTHFNASSLWPLNTVGRYYERHGMRAAETQWLGEITCVIGRKD
jgi:hypothetical protein